MKTSIKKILCVALVIMMAVPMIAINTGAANTTYKSYADAQNGDRLYKADFAGDDYWKPSKENGSKFADRGDITSPNLTVTTDTADTTKANFTASASGHNFWGDEVKGLTLGADYNYTVKFTLTANASKDGFGVLIDGMTGIYVQSGKGRLQKTTQKLTGHDYISFSGSKTDQEFAAEITGMTVALYIKIDGAWSKIDEATLSEYANENLCLSFYLYNAINTDVSDMEVYKGSVSEIKPVVPETPDVPDTPVLPAVTFVEYAAAQDGDVLYNVNFNGTAGLFAPADGVGKWNKTGANVSPDGSALTFGFTKEWTEEPDDGDGTWGRARFAGSLKNYTTVGTSYTIQFTLDSAAPVGIVLDGGGGFVINPAENTVSVGRYGSWSKIAKAQTYAGPASNKQTYAIELAFPSTTMTNYNNIESYCPEVYRLYVLDETTSKWQLIREIDVSLSIQFDWEAAYSYLDFAVIRYSDKYQINADGDYILSTLSDVSLYKGIGLLDVEEVTPPADNSGNDDNTGNTGNTDNTGNTTTDDQTEKKPAETYAPPKSVTEAATEADTEDTAEKNGCGSSLAFAGLAVVGACTAVVAVKRRKNKED